MRIPDATFRRRECPRPFAGTKELATDKRHADIAPRSGTFWTQLCVGPLASCYLAGHGPALEYAKQHASHTCNRQDLIRR